jgi:hypothetical protein
MKHSATFIADAVRRAVADRASQVVNGAIQVRDCGIGGTANLLLFFLFLSFLADAKGWEGVPHAPRVTEACLFSMASKAGQGH